MMHTQVHPAGSVDLYLLGTSTLQHISYDTAPMGQTGLLKLIDSAVV